MKKTAIRRNKQVDVSRETFRNFHKQTMFHGSSCISTKTREQYVVEIIKLTAISI